MVQERKDVPKDIDIELAKFLLEKVDGKKSTFTYTYKETAEALSKRLGREINPHFGLRYPLGRIMELCCELDLPIITVLGRHAGKKESVGEGFYSLACDLRPEYKKLSPDAVLKKERERVQQCEDWSALRDYLNKF